MGTFSVEFKISGIAEDGPSESVEGIVDTGALYSQVPEPLASRLGLKPVQRRLFRLADGSTQERNLAHAIIRQNGRETSALVVLGGPDAPILFGATTMEGLGVKPDPVRQVLEPTTLYLCSLQS